MKSRNLFLKPRSSFHGRWWIMALLLVGLYLFLRAPHDRPQDELPWQPPIEPDGVMIRDSAAVGLAAAPATSAPTPSRQESAASSPQPQAAPASASAETAAAAEATQTPAQAQVRQAIEQWSRAWSARDVNAYLGMYSRSFVPDSGQSKSAWEQTRRQRILSKTAIVHEVRNLQITLQGNKAVVQFEQAYTADKVRSVGPKTLRLELDDDKWLIVSESTS